jgi:hypothetical protein
MPALGSPVTQPPASCLPGSVVSIWIFPWFRHRGIVSDRVFGHKPLIISNSARVGGFAEEPWDIFAAGQTVDIDGYPSNLLPFEVLRRARSTTGKKYHLLNWNCEHLTRYAHGLKPESQQVATTVILATIVLIAGAVHAKAKLR